MRLETCWKYLIQSILDEVEHLDLFYNDFMQFMYINLPFIGLGFSVWGLVKKEEKQ